MTVRELYQEIGSDFEDVLARIPNEALIGKLVLKFPKEDSYDVLVASMEKQDYPEALVAVHTMKGLSLNLGFTALGAACSAMNEALKMGIHENLEELYREVTAEYQKVVALLGKLDP